MSEQKTNVGAANGGSTLFDLSSGPPTTRQVADRVREGRAAHPSRPADLPAAVRRADDARYQEVTCRSALNRVRGMPFGWTLNPYRGCTHGCHYCFARRYQPHLELDAGDEFASVILVKVNFVEMLRRELAGPRRPRAPIGFGTATDPYQPAEGRYRLSRGALAALVERPAPVGLITKGPMVVRDVDLLRDLSARTECLVHVSVPTVDEDAWSALEPGTAHPLQRLRAVRALGDAGIEAGVLVAPIVPGLTSHPAKIERTIKAVADHGARFCGADVLHLEGGTREHFLRFLDREFPALAPRIDRLYAGKHAPRRYRDQVRRVLELLRRRHRLPARRAAPMPAAARPRAAPPPTPRQALLPGQARRPGPPPRP